MESTWNAQIGADPFKSPHRVYIFAGEDALQKEEALAILVERCVDAAFRDFDLEFVAADALTPDEILAAAGLAPFGSLRRLVVVRGAEIYRRRDRTADADRLAAGIAQIGPSSSLVLIAAPTDAGARGKIALTIRLDAAANEAGCIVRFAAPTADGLADWIAKRAREADKEIEDEAADLLLRLTHGRQDSLATELEKAICYAGERRVITTSDVEATASRDPDDVIFRLVDAISDGSAARALPLLHETLRAETRPQSAAGRLLALLGRQFRLLIQARELSAAGISPAAVRSLPPAAADSLPSEASITGVAWKARELFQLARRWTRPGLANAMNMILECDLAIKGGGGGSEDVVINLETLVIRLCANR